MAQRLVGDGEQVLDVPAKLAGRVRPTLSAPGTGRDRKATGFPGFEAADQVGRLVQTQVLEHGGGQAGGVPLRAQDHDRLVVALDLGMPVDGVEMLRFLSDEEFEGPVLIISGFDRRVLESAFRLGEALGLTMMGPLEKPVRLEDLEQLLRRMKPVVPS